MISPAAWEGSSSNSENTLHQLAPYIGKMKSTMAKTLVDTYSSSSHTILDPFVGSGTVALESIIAGRNVFGTDVNPYAVVLTKAKLHPPPTLNEALQRVEWYLTASESMASEISLQNVPSWVKAFFHPRTLRETLALVKTLKEAGESFLLACLLGILHHQRPGFLSYPASHLVPYLRTKHFPRKAFPQLYRYRPLRPRLEAKVQRVYKRFPDIKRYTVRKCLRRDAAHLNLPKEYFDAIITSPPYMNALDYGRDNRLRLWFLGVSETQRYDQRTHTEKTFIAFMECCITKFHYTLKGNGVCVLVIGEVGRSRRPVNAADLVSRIATRKPYRFRQEELVEDSIPDVRRARREGGATKREWIVVLRKLG